MDRSIPLRREKKNYFNEFMPKWNRTVHYFLGVSIRREKKKRKKKIKKISFNGFTPKWIRIMREY